MGYEMLIEAQFKCLVFVIGCGDNVAGLE